MPMSGAVQCYKLNSRFELASVRAATSSTGTPLSAATQSATRPVAHGSLRPLTALSDAQRSFLTLAGAYSGSSSDERGSAVKSACAAEVVPICSYQSLARRQMRTVHQGASDSKCIRSSGSARTMSRFACVLSEQPLTPRSRPRSSSACASANVPSNEWTTPRKTPFSRRIRTRSTWASLVRAWRKRGRSKRLASWS